MPPHDPRATPSCRPSLRDWLQRWKARRDAQAGQEGAGAEATRPRVKKLIAYQRKKRKG